MKRAIYLQTHTGSGLYSPHVEIEPDGEGGFTVKPIEPLRYVARPFSPPGGPQ